MTSSAERLSGVLPFSNRGVSQNRLAAIVEIILVVIVAILLARLVMSLLAPLPLPSGDVVASAAPSEQPAEITAALNPFPETPVEAVVVADVVADTDLNLTLMGTWSEGDGKGSAAIQTPDNKQNRFTVGDQIVNGVTLEEVHSDHIVINRGGSREALRFETKSQSSRQPARRAQTRNSPPARAVTQAVSGGLADIIRAAPGRNSNGDTTIELYAARNRAAFARMGLKNGDVLHSVNGTPAPTDAAQLAAFFAQIQQSNSAEIEVNRGGEIISITIDTGNASGE